MARPDYDVEPSAKSNNAGETKEVEEKEPKDDEASVKEEDDDGEDEE